MRLAAGAGPQRERLGTACDGPWARRILDIMLSGWSAGLMRHEAMSVSYVGSRVGVTFAGEPDLGRRRGCLPIALAFWRACLEI